MGKETSDENSETEWPASPGPHDLSSESVNERLLPEDESSHDAVQDEEKAGDEKKKKVAPPPGTATFSSFMVRNIASWFRTLLIFG